MSRKKYHFDFQIQEILEGHDLESSFVGTQEEYDELSFLLGMYLAKIHSIKLTGFGLFDPESMLQNKLEGLHVQFFDYIMTCLDDDIRYLFDVKIVSKDLSKQL